MNDKIYYIKENIINNNINHKIVYDFIIKYNIPYIKNFNGIFLTISGINDKIINELYELIKHNINNYKYIDSDMEIFNNNKEDKKKLIETKIKKKP